MNHYKASFRWRIRINKQQIRLKKIYHGSVMRSHNMLITIHYINDIMTTMASQITSITVVYSRVYSDADQRKHQSSAPLAFVWGTHRNRWIPRTNGQWRGNVSIWWRHHAESFISLVVHITGIHSWAVHYPFSRYIVDRLSTDGIFSHFYFLSQDMDRLASFLIVLLIRYRYFENV